MTADAGQIRKRINSELDARREQLHRINDAALTTLVEHIRDLVPDPHFDPVEYLSAWLWAPAVIFGGLTPAAMLEREDGLNLLIENLGRQAAGVSV
jgi:hypothetical protein